MEIKNINTLPRGSAILNEYKGFLFEYLVGNAISLKFGIQNIFQEELHLNIVDRLSQYETMIRSESPELLDFLSVSASLLAKEMNKEIEGNVEQISLAGKKQLKTDSEEDLIVRTRFNKYLFSLKFYKKNLGINTKSGGILSFIPQYFHTYEQGFINKIQKDINSFVIENYKEFVLKFLTACQKRNDQETARIKSISDFQHPEHMLKICIQNNQLSELPGELPAFLKSVVHQYYSLLKKKLYDKFLELLQKDPIRFRDGLMKLCGFSDSNQIHCILTYCQQVEKKYYVDKIKILKYIDILPEVSAIKIVNHINSSYFDILFDDYILSIRVKPMNKFTSIALKINCSLKKSDNINE